jgi:hypothetical protein
MHKVGYARVSSVGQNPDSQVDALQKAGCKKIFTDKMTGSRMDRPGWDQLMDYVRPGDALVVTELSRMTRFPDPSARNGSTAGAEAGQSGLSTRKYRHQHRHRSLFPVDDGRYPSDGTGTPRRARRRRPDIRKGGGRPEGGHEPT